MSSQKNLLQHAKELHGRGDFAGAHRAYLTVISAFPQSYEALHYVGLLYLQQGEFTHATDWIKRSLKVKQDQPDASSNLAYCLNSLGEYEAAIDECNKALVIDPFNDGAYTNLGNAQKSIGLLAPAEQSYLSAFKLVPNNPQYIYNLANIQFDQKKYHSAIKLFLDCISIAPSFPEAHNNLSACYIKLQEYESALHHSKIACDLRPLYLDALTNTGNALLGLRRANDALNFFIHVSQLGGVSAEICVNIGNALSDLGRSNEALERYIQAIKLNANYADAWKNQALLLSGLGRYGEAIPSYQKALQLDPEAEYIFGNLIHAKTKICDWSEIETLIARLLEQAKSGKKVTAPFPLLSIRDEPEIHGLVAEVFSKDKFPASLATPEVSLHDTIRKVKENRKIRLGYFSADFHDHPTSYLMAGVFELHSKDLFELHAFSFGPRRADMMRARVANAFDYFYDVTDRSDQEIISLARNNGIDIAIDLKGFTQDSRPVIFASRVASVQVSFLGFPGTMGMSAMDYLIADPVVIPCEERKHYSEKVVYLPLCYQPHDFRRLVISSSKTRGVYGLPDQGFVFACFNNSYKITPTIFDSWLRILKSVPESVLWLFKDNSAACENLLNEARLQGLDPARIVFANPLPHEEHLERISNADLFLDTFPYNAHTTASDALWVGLPVLTLKGRSFASRVATSILTFIDVPELIAETQQEYEKKAINFALNRQALSLVSASINQAKAINNFFKTQVFVEKLEASFSEMVRRSRAGLPPGDLWVG